MLLTITTTHRPALDLGYLLHKHPHRLQSFDLSFGKAHVFYPEVDAAPVRPHPGVRDPEALLGRGRRKGEVAGQGVRVGRRAPEERGVLPALSEVPAEPLPGGPRPTRAGGGTARSRRGRADGRKRRR